MSYLVLARKWRPRTFEDLVGQEPIARMLKNALEQGKISHAYIFSGPRGVGKTTTARILAKALNCKQGPTPSPCGDCESCRAVSESSSVDVIEIDGASNNSVDDVRDLRERVKYAPSGGSYKVYIIDEVHMLSGSAFNALLKTLEEPPPHVIFVLATTEMKKIPATVLSRCQHMPFRRISSAVIKARLQQISEAEHIDISGHALGLIAKAADGSMRDSLTILDQVSSFSETIDEQQVQNLLGITDFGLLEKTAGALISGSRSDLVEIVESLAEQGVDFRTFVKELVQFFRDILVASVVKDPSAVLEASGEELTAITALVAASSESQLTLMLTELIRAEADVRNSSLPRITLEMALIRASFLSSLKPVAEIIRSLDRAGGSSAARPVRQETEKAVPKKPAGEKQKTPEHKPALKPGPELPKKPETEKKMPETQPEPVPAAAAVQDEPDLMEEYEPDYPVADMPPSEEEADAEAAGDLPVTDSVFVAWNRVLEAIEPPLASKLAHAAIELKGDELQVSLPSGQAVFTDAIRKDLGAVESLLSEYMGRRLKIELGLQQKTKADPGNDLKKKAADEPVVREALELFEGRIVDVIPVDPGTTLHGGKNV